MRETDMHKLQYKINSNQELQTKTHTKRRTFSTLCVFSVWHRKWRVGEFYQQSNHMTYGNHRSWTEHSKRMYDMKCESNKIKCIKSDIENCYYRWYSKFCFVLLFFASTQIIFCIKYNNAINFKSLRKYLECVLFFFRV